MNDALISAHSIYKKFGTVVAVDGVDFDLHHREYLALLGPNGAGKTTLVEMIEGIRNPDQGEILIKGMKLAEHKNELYNIMGISFQDTRFLEKITVAETLNLFASFYESAGGKVDQVLDMVSLQEKRKAYTKNLSGGQRQRLALAIALVNDPEILILDEPTTGLDPTARREIWDILIRLKNEEATSLILTTHYMEEAAYLCDKIIIMDQGKIIASGSLRELLERENMRNVAEFYVPEGLRNEVLHDAQNLKMKLDEKTGKIQCILENPEKELPELLRILQKHQISLKDFDFHKPTLDDLFLTKTGRRIHD